MDIALLNERLKSLEAEDILEWAWETFRPNVAASSSFQTQSVPLLHLVSRICPEMPIIFIDTGFHFPETLEYRDELRRRFGLNVLVFRSVSERSSLLEKHEEPLYRRDPDLCCYINKVKPMEAAISRLSLKALISGIRMEQTPHRQTLRIIESQSGNVLRIHPLLKWTREDLWEYIDEHRLPLHPLFSKGYPSIGCAPCTRPVQQGEDERAGRWAGTEKKECGLHLNLAEMRNPGEKHGKQ